MKPKKKNKFFTFCFSFIPGAAEMYMGFMINGFTLMLLFFMSFMLPMALRMNDYIVMVAAALWFYGFFHARNLAGASEEEIAERKDVSILEEILGDRAQILPQISRPFVRKVLAVALIFFGASALWETFIGAISRFVYSYCSGNILVMEGFELLERVPSLVFAVILIYIGVQLIKGKKVALLGAPEEKLPAAQQEETIPAVQSEEEK